MKHNILVVDDNSSDTELLTMVLQTLREDLEIYVARDGQEALTFLQPGSDHEPLSFPPLSVILLDILLNNENTWDFLSELKRNPETKSIPVYVITMVENQQKALALGADDFYVKPLDRLWLLNKLRLVESTRPRPDLLVIEDDEVSRYLLKGHLSDTFSRVLEASSGMEGIQMAKERHPAAIFLDLMMPDLDGFAVLEKLKSDESTKDIPVIIHSARHLSEQEKARLDREAAAIVPKNPAEREATLLHIRKALTDAAVVMDKGEGVGRGG